MYDPKIQLEILDEIEATQDHRNIDEIDLTNPDRKQNYDFLLAERCVNERIEKTGDSPENNRLQKIGIALTHRGGKVAI